MDLPDTSTGRDLAELVARGDVSGASFGFRVREDDWSVDDGGMKFLPSCLFGNIDGRAKRNTNLT